MITLVQYVQDHQENIKTVGDGLSVGTLLATIAGILPHIATLFTAIWAILRVYESKTVQDYLKKRRRLRRRRKK